MFTRGEWGTICDQGFEKIDAVVVCRQLGYYGPNPKVHKSTYFGQGTGPVHMKKLNCLGNSDHIGQCLSERPEPESICNTHRKDVSVTCVDNKGKITYITTYNDIVIS